MDVRDCGELLGGVNPAARVALDDVFRRPVLSLLLGDEACFGAAFSGGVGVLDAPPDPFRGLVFRDASHSCQPRNSHEPDQHIPDTRHSPGQYTARS